MRRNLLSCKKAEMPKFDLKYPEKSAELTIYVETAQIFAEKFVHMHKIRELGFETLKMPLFRDFFEFVIILTVFLAI